MASPCLGVVIVAFNSADVILDCLESLLAAQDVRLRIVVVDNASTDDTARALRAWADGTGVRDPADDLPFPLPVPPKPVLLRPDVPALDAAGPEGAGHAVTLLELARNGGFAAGVNRGLALLAAVAGLDRFWVLNPDSIVPPGTAAALARHPEPAGGFALMGGRVLYCPSDDVIQIDGGTINRKTGVTGNVNQYASHRSTRPPSPQQMDFITGASMVASRRFWERAGPMPEDYFLYYEEVDWAMRRGDLPLVYCPEAIVYHRAGTAIGSPAPGRPASPFSLYFKHRGRLRFMRRHFPRAVPMAHAYSLAKAAQLWLKGYRIEARTLLGASFGRPPSPGIRARLSPEAAALAFAPER
jgi:GT2 family glycosyltransferase